MTKHVDLTCCYCSKEYSLTPSRYANKVRKGTKNFFCSAECHQLHRRKVKVPNVACKECLKPFYRSGVKDANVFCSQTCSAVFNNRKTGPRNKPKERTCTRCKQPFTRTTNKRTKLCSSCNTNKPNFETKTIGEYANMVSVKGKHPSWLHSHVRSFNRSWNKSLVQLPCQLCGYTAHVELAHIKSVASFPPDTLLGVVNAPDNILVLCPNHHWEFDNGVLLLSAIPPRKLSGALSD